VEEEGTPISRGGKALRGKNLKGRKFLLKEPGPHLIYSWGKKIPFLSEKERMIPPLVDTNPIYE